MVDKDENPAVEDEPKPAKLKALKGVVFAGAGAMAMGLAAAGATYFLAPGSKGCAAGDGHSSAGNAHAAAHSDVTFVNLDPLVVTLGPNAKSRYLKISLSLETTKNHEKNLYELSPRIRDALNTYLRAVEEDDLIRPSSMARLRAQMLRRLQLAAPSEQISDVLITDFVLN